MRTLRSHTKKAGVETGHAHQAIEHAMGGRGFACPTTILSSTV